MKLSLNWIRDFVNLDNIDLSKLVYDLTMSTVEVEDAVSLGGQFENMVVGVVEKISKHPDADKLVVCSVDLGDGLHEIVCGGTNLSEGMKVAVAKPGAKVRWHGEGELVELKKTKVRGVESYGMICASSEIGLFDLFPYTEEATIVDLSAFDAPAGTPLAQALGLDDTILVIDNKSLTNRPDLWGHYGIARELSAIYDLPLKEISPPVVNTQGGNNSFEIIIKDSNLCPRYIGVKLDNVLPRPAPFEIQKRLWSVGARPINAIVDITNYVMLETGQPTHAFDADHVQNTIIIRPAAKGEKLKLLDGKELYLTSEDLVIASEKEPIALAGVMGGEKDSILPETKNVILEIANFSAMTVRKTAMRFDSRTEAATRFEKGIDPQRVDLALTSAMRLFSQLYQDMKITGFTDNYPLPLECCNVSVSQDWLSKRLGRRMPPEQLSGLLERLGFEVKFEGDIMDVSVPSWRSTGDVSLPDDIMEEIARIYGLENFQATPIVTAFESAINQPGIDIDRKIREYLAYTCSMNEISTYPWTSEEFVVATLGEDAAGDGCGMIEMTAPPSPSERFLRNSLIPGLCKAVSENLRYFDDFAIFESAQVFFDRDYTAVYDKRESLPLQRRYVAGAFVAPREHYSGMYRTGKGVLESLPRTIHTEPIGFEKSGEKPHWADDTVWQTIIHCGGIVGYMGLLSQKTALACDIKNAAVMLFELDIDSLKPLPSRENAYRRIPEYQMTEYDISLLFNTQTPWSDIKTTAAGKEGPDNYLRAVGFVEEYKGKQVPDGKKSVTLRLTIGSLTKTLTSADIDSCVNSVTKRLTKTLGAETRA